MEDAAKAPRTGILSNAPYKDRNSPTKFKVRGVFLSPTLFYLALRAREKKIKRKPMIKRERVTLITLR